MLDSRVFSQDDLAYFGRYSFQVEWSRLDRGCYRYYETFSAKKNVMSQFWFRIMLVPKKLLVLS